jgi:hypothetical protein
MLASAMESVTKTIHQMNLLDVENRGEGQETSCLLFIEGCRQLGPRGQHVEWEIYRGILHDSGTEGLEVCVRTVMFI